jgi:hypothetical protein
MAIEKLSGTPEPALVDQRSSETFVPLTEKAEPWISGDVGEALNSEVYPDRDVLFGWGEAHEYGQVGECRLGLYPEHQTLVYEDPQVYLVIKKPSRVTLTEAAVFVDTPGETQTSFFAFDRDGGMKLRVKPKQLALDQLADGRGDPISTGAGNSNDVAPICEPITETLVSEMTAPWEETPSAVSQNDRELNGGGVAGDSDVSVSSVEPTKKKSKRVDLKAARLGRPIVCRETKNGKTITKFPVAEHNRQEDGTDITAWHTVMAFNVLAERLCREFDAGEIAVGDELKVAAYPQTQMIPDRNGELKAHEVLFAAHVGKVKKGGDR